MGIVLNGGYLWNLLNKIIISKLELCLNNLYSINKMYMTLQSSQNCVIWNNLKCSKEF